MLVINTSTNFRSYVLTRNRSRSLPKASNTCPPWMNIKLLNSNALETNFSRSNQRKVKIMPNITVYSDLLRLKKIRSEMKFLTLMKLKLKSLKRINSRSRRARLRSLVSTNPSIPPPVSSQEHSSPLSWTLRSLSANLPKSLTQEKWLHLTQNWLSLTETSISNQKNPVSPIPVRRSQTTNLNKAKMIWVPSKWKEVIKYNLEMKMKKKT